MKKSYLLYEVYIIDQNTIYPVGGAKNIQTTSPPEK